MDTTALLIVGSMISIGMLILGILNFSSNKTKSDNATAIQTAKLEVDIEYIKAQLTNVTALLTVHNTNYMGLEKRVCEIESNCKVKNKEYNNLLNKGK